MHFNLILYNEHFSIKFHHMDIASFFIQYPVMEYLSCLKHLFIKNTTMNMIAYKPDN